MKSLVVALVSVALGLIVGCGLTWYEFAGVQELFSLGGGSAASPGAAKVPAAKAKVEGGQDYGFGVMHVGGTKSHEFIFRNLGNLPLKLEEGGKPTCQCTQFEIPKAPIEPGESAKVFLEWKPKVFSPEFSQHAEVRTNDPANPTIRLTIHGNVLQFARPVPETVLFNGISTNEERPAEVTLFGYSDDPLKIASNELVEAATAALFDVRWEPLSKEQLAAERHAKSGLRFTITAKSGLPLGQINQTIRLVFDGNQNQSLDIPIKGTVVSDISVLGGANFDAERNELRLGPVKNAAGAKTVLRLLIKGPNRKEAGLKLGVVDPEGVLRATLSEPTEINAGKVVVHLLTIEIPPGSPPTNRIDSPQTKPGKIQLQSALPDLKEFNVLVSFAVED